MRINEFLTESELQEGPILNKIGAGIGKAVGTAAKGVGAVAGGVAGLGRAIKKGFTAGRDTVGGAGDDEADAADGSAPAASGGAPQQAAPAPAGNAPAGNAPASGGAPQQAAPAAPAAPADNASAAPAGNAPAAPKSQFNKLSAAANGEPAEPAANPKADTAYAQAQKAIAGLNPKQKGELVAMLQKEVSKKPPASPKTKADPGAGAMGNMAGQLAKGGAAEPNTMANAPVSKTNTAKPGNPNAEPAASPKKNLGFGFNSDTGEPFSSAEERTAAGGAGEAAAQAYPAADTTAAPTKPKRAPRTKAPAAPVDPTAAPAAEPTAPKKKGGRKKPAAPSQAEIDADRDRIMGNFTDSVNRYKKVIAENAIRSGEISIFRKR